MKPLIRAAGAATLAFAAALAPAAANSYPEKPVTMVVPFPPGGSSDMVARVLSTKLATSLGQPFVIENQPGATGAIGAARVKRAPAGARSLKGSARARSRPFRSRACR